MRENADQNTGIIELGHFITSDYYENLSSVSVLNNQEFYLIDYKEE